MVHFVLTLERISEILRGDPFGSAADHLPRKDTADNSYQVAPDNCFFLCVAIFLSPTVQRFATCITACEIFSVIIRGYKLVVVHFPKIKKAFEASKRSKPWGDGFSYHLILDISVGAIH